MAFDPLRTIPGDSEREERSRGAGIAEIADRPAGAEAADLSSWMKSPHRIAVDGKGYVWRAYTNEDFWSMAPTNPDNSPIPQPVTYYVPEAEVTELREALTKLVDLHHRMLSNSKKHDPESREWFECDCLTCAAVQHALRKEN